MSHIPPASRTEESAVSTSKPDADDAPDALDVDEETDEVAGHMDRWDGAHRRPSDRSALARNPQPSGVLPPSFHPMTARVNGTTDSHPPGRGWCLHQPGAVAPLPSRRSR